MTPKFVDQPFLGEIVAFFCLVVIWSFSGFLTAITTAALADLAISAIAWRAMRRKSPTFRNNAGS